jgi:hypothetical protein
MLKLSMRLVYSSRFHFTTLKLDTKENYKR